MALFRRGGERQAPREGPGAPSGPATDPLALLRDLDDAVAQYLEMVDRRDLVYPACQRSPDDIDGDARAIWQHTRLEAARYLTMIPGRDARLLIAPSRQFEMMDAFLRYPPHDHTIVGFTLSTVENVQIAITGGLNWLNHCSTLARVDPARFSGTLRNFSKVVAAAKQWWAMEGAESRCAQMLLHQQEPPLMLYLVWLEYTRLAKEIASAAFFGPPVTSRLEGRFRKSDVNLDHATESVARFRAAQDPEDLVG